MVERTVNCELETCGSSLDLATKSCVSDLSSIT